MFCRMYCDVPPDEVSKCERIRPQLIRLSSGVTRVYHFKIYDNCEYESQLTNKYILGTTEVLDVTKTNSIRTNTHSTTVSRTVDSITSGIYDIVTGDYTVIEEGTFYVNDGLFDITISGLEKGYYKLRIKYYEYDELVCSCLFPIDVC